MGQGSVGLMYKLTSIPVGANDSKVVALVFQALEIALLKKSGQVQPKGAASFGNIVAIFRYYVCFLVLLYS